MYPHCFSTKLNLLIVTMPSLLWRLWRRLTKQQLPVPPPAALFSMHIHSIWGELHAACESRYSLAHKAWPYWLYGCLTLIENGLHTASVYIALCKIDGADLDDSFELVRAKYWWNIFSIFTIFYRLPLNVVDKYYILCHKIQHQFMYPLIHHTLKLTMHVIMIFWSHKYSNHDDFL